MAPIEFFMADPVRDRKALIELNTEYMRWVFDNVERNFGIPADSIVGMSAQQYASSVIEKICGDPPPKGVFYLVNLHGALAGMGGLRYLRPGVAEVKRIYFRPEFRGHKLGEQMLRRILSDAATFGYDSVCLDSGPFMTSAHRTYERCGFSDCPPYADAEVPKALHDRWRFMELKL